MTFLSSQSQFVPTYELIKRPVKPHVTHAGTSVGFDATVGAVRKAQDDYLYGTSKPQPGQKEKKIHNRNACSETIESCEKFINGPHADPIAIEQQIIKGNLKKSATSAHLFIQLGE